MEAQSTKPKCSSCKYVVDDYSPEFIEQMKTMYNDYKDFQLFLNDFKRDPDSVRSECVTCRSLKWHNKYKSYTQVKLDVRSTDASKRKRLLKIGMVIIVMMISLALGYYSPDTETNINSLSENQLKSTMDSVRNQFPLLQKSILKKLSSAFSRLQKPGEPIILMLLHDDTNKKTTDCLASFASISAKQYIFTNTKKSLWINGSEWTSNLDFNQENLLFEKLITSVEENEVLVLENLQDLPWSFAKMLHHLCDTENPKFTKAMYMLELRVKDDLKSLSDGEKIVMAERIMNTIWQDAPNDLRAPLITRLTSYVDAVLWESDQPCHRESFIKISP